MPPRAKFSGGRPFLEQTRVCTSDDPAPISSTLRMDRTRGIVPLARLFWVAVSCFGTPGSLWAESHATIPSNATSSLRLYVEGGINHSARAVAFSRDGQYVAGNGIDRTVRVWRMIDGRELVAIPWEIEMSSFAFHPTRRLLAGHNSHSPEFQIWDLESGLLASSSSCDGQGTHAVIFNAAGDRLVHVAGSELSGSTWDFTAAAMTSPELPARSDGGFAQLSGDGKLACAVDAGQSIRIIDWQSQAVLNTISLGGEYPEHVALGRTRLAIVWGHRIDIWAQADLPGQIRKEKSISVELCHAAAVSPDEQSIACALENGSISIVSLDSGKETTALVSLGNRVEQVGLSASPSMIAIQVWYDSVVHLPLGRGSAVFAKGGQAVFEEAGQWLDHARFNGTEIYVQRSPKFDATFLRRNSADGPLLGTIVVLDKMRGWVVASPDGRFDTNLNLDEIAGVHWVMNGDRFNPLPLEIYMRDYFTPNLLSKLINDQPAAIRPVNVLNPLRPRVGRPEVVRYDGDRVTVAVDVTPDSPATVNGHPGADLDAFDLRLFRDGHLVAKWPSPPAAKAVTGSLSPTDDDRSAWRESTRISLGPDGRRRVLFENIRVPQRSSIDQVRFAAYAYNSDRVKGQTSPPLLWQRPSGNHGDVRRKAFVICMGVNATEAGGPWDLSVAVPSAQRAMLLWRERLAAEYDVVETSLQSDLNAEGEISIASATKDNLRSVFDILSGHAERVDAARRRVIDPDLHLQTATPDDAVVLHITGHGFVDGKELFHMVPFDTGTRRGITEDSLKRDDSQRAETDAGRAAQQFLDHTISSDDFTEWWSEIDAEEMVMVLDSCHSGAVSGKGFRPAPLGDRSFGQMAYDKGLRILAATQPDKVARGTAVQGKATLVVEAMQAAVATSAGKSLGEWLKATRDLTVEQGRIHFPSLAAEDLQQPELMDFRRQP